MCFVIYSLVCALWFTRFCTSPFHSLCWYSNIRQSRLFSVPNGLSTSRIVLRAWPKWGGFHRAVPRCGPLLPAAQRGKVAVLRKTTHRNRISSALRTTRWRKTCTRNLGFWKLPTNHPHALFKITASDKMYPRFNKSDFNTFISNIEANISSKTFKSISEQNFEAKGFDFSNGFQTIGAGN